MPNDRNSSSILSGKKLTNYSTLSKFLSNSAKPQQSQVADPINPAQNEEKDKEMESLEVLESLLSQNIAEESKQNLVQGQTQVSGRRKESLDNLAEQTQAPETKAAPVEEAATPEVSQSPESPELVELSKEIKEVSKETREQREAAEIKEKQAAIDELSKQAAVPPAPQSGGDNKPVVILPITQENKKEARLKGTKYSLKWLVEWANKISKIFSGAVVYKEELDQSEDV